MRTTNRSWMSTALSPHLSRSGTRPRAAVVALGRGRTREAVSLTGRRNRRPDKDWLAFRSTTRHTGLHEWTRTCRPEVRCALAVHVARCACCVGSRRTQNVQLEVVAGHSEVNQDMQGVAASGIAHRGVHIWIVVEHRGWEHDRLFACPSASTTYCPLPTTLAWVWLACAALGNPITPTAIAAVTSASRLAPRALISVSCFCAACHRRRSSRLASQPRGVKR